MGRDHVIKKLKIGHIPSLRTGPGTTKHNKSSFGIRGKLCCYALYGLFFWIFQNLTSKETKFYLKTKNYLY